MPLPRKPIGNKIKKFGSVKGQKIPKCNVSNKFYSTIKKKK
jgi:hypothetical protein